MDRRLTLELDQLRVESFATVEAEDASREVMGGASRIFSMCRSCERTCTCETF